ncbi:hypothetical protein GCM10023238_04140 [Streptomyces heliomycini]
MKCKERARPGTAAPARREVGPPVLRGARRRRRGQGEAITQKKKAEKKDEAAAEYLFVCVDRA